MNTGDLASRADAHAHGAGQRRKARKDARPVRRRREHRIYMGLFAIARQGYQPFYALLQQMKNGGAPTPEIVPMDAYFIEADGQMPGEISVRHRLTPILEQIGGHIGYKVRPSWRNLGVATSALHLALDMLRPLGLENALVPCNTTNAASARVIEKCSGVRTLDACVEDRVARRYWVPTPPPDALSHP